ncbi:MAG TPA: hypothetical protein VGP07_16450 [Polyangia bacterium]|jgi:hypothetical protein
MLRPRHRPAVRRAFWSTLVVLGLGASGCHRARLPPKPDGAAVVVAAEEPAAEVGFTMADEVEPNDLLANAQPLSPSTETGAGVVGRLVSAPGSKAKDVDLFRVVVPPPAVVSAGADGAVAAPRQRLGIEVHPDPGSVIAVDVLDDQGHALISAVGATAGEAEGVPNLTVTPGNVFVRVRPGPVPGGAGAAVAQKKDAAPPTAGGYRLTVRLLAFEPGDEVEPNGKAALASEVNAEGDIAGFLGWRHDEDWFRVPTAGLPEGGLLSADLEPVEGVAASLSVYDSVEHKMIEQHGRRGDRVALRNVRLPSSDPNVYVVVAADSGRNLDKRYTLRLRVEDAKSDSEVEPNDDPAHAVPLVDGTLTGTLGPGDADVFRYTVPEPTELSIDVAPPPHVDVLVDVLRDDGTVAMKVDSGKRGVAEKIPNLYVAGSVLLRLSPTKGDGNLDDPYRITVAGRPIEAGAEHEPNGTATTATALPVGVTGSGLIFPRGDIDFWTASAVPTDTASGNGGSLSVNVRGIAGLTLDVRVRALAGRELARFRVGSDGSAPTRVLPQGEACCLIEVRDAMGRAANPKDRYTLWVTP